ncbi:MAG: autotransporter-associated beta strand repeat-containing protein [Thermoguttaceae bacterium]|nr:autotransporter-associated beta strand repeat-containing protein [Thermoguttaceae bacterium]
MLKFTKSFFAFLALAALAVPAYSVTIDTEQTFDTSPAWGENVFITETGKVTLGQDVLIGQTTNITIDIATGGSLTSNNTKTGNHDANNSLINANGASLLFTGGGTFIKTGTGSLAMQSAGYTGGGDYNFSVKFAFSDGALIDIQQGTLRNGGWNQQNWGSNQADLQIASGANLDLWDGSGMTIDSLVGAGTVIMGQTGTRVLTIGSAGSTWSGGIPEFSGSTTTDAAKALLIGLNKTGTGTQILSGTWTGGGGFTVSGGTLQIGNGTTGKVNTGSAVSIADGASLVFDTDEASTLSGVVSGSGNLTVTNGTVSLTNTGNTFNGYWTIGPGGKLDSAVKLDMSKGSIAEGAEFYMYVNDADTANAYTSTEFSDLRVLSTGTVGLATPASKTVAASAATILSTNTPLNKKGAGTFQLTEAAPDTFTSPINVHEGAISLGNGTTAATINAASDITVDAGAQFIFDEGAGTNTVLMNKITGDGALVIASGTLSLTTDTPVLASREDGTYGTFNFRLGTSQVTIKNGAKLYAADRVTPSFNDKAGTITVESGGVLEMNSTAGTNHNADNTVNAVNYTMTINGAGTILKTGTGAVALLNRNGVGNAVTKIAQGLGGWIDVQEGVLMNGGWSAGINWLSNQGSLNIAANAQFNGWDGSANSVYIDSLTGAGRIYGAHYILGVANNEANATYGVANNTATFSGTITNDRSGTIITKRGTGTQILTGTNTYAGATNVQGGVLQIGDGTTGSIGSSKTFNVTAGTLLFKTPTAHTADVLTGVGTVALDGAGQLTVNNMANFSCGTFDVKTATDTVVSNLPANSSTAFHGNVTGNGTVRFNGDTTTTLNLYDVSVANTAKLELNGGKYTTGGDLSGTKLNFVGDSTLGIHSAANQIVKDQCWNMTLYIEGNQGKDGRVAPGGAYTSTKTYGDAGLVYDMWQCANNPTKSEVSGTWMTSNYASMSYLTTINVLEDVSLDFSGAFDDTQGVWVRECYFDGSPKDDAPWVQLLGYAGNCATNTATGVSLAAGVYQMDVRVCDQSGDRYAMANVKDADGKNLGIGMRLNGASTYSAMNIDQTTGVLNGSDGKIIVGTPQVNGVQKLENASFDIASGVTVNVEVPAADTNVTGYEITSAAITGAGTLRLSNDTEANIPFKVTDLQTAGNLTVGQKTTVTELTGMVGGNFKVEPEATINFTVDSEATDAPLQVTGMADFGENSIFNITVTGPILEDFQLIPVVQADSLTGAENLLTNITLVDSSAFAFTYYDAETGIYGVRLASASAIPEPAAWLLLVLGVSLGFFPPLLAKKSKKG